MRFCIGSSRREPGPEAGGEREVPSLREAKAAYERAKRIWVLITDVRLSATADPETVDEIVANGGRPIEPGACSRLLDHLKQSPNGSAPLAECERVIGESEFPRGDVLARIQERLIWIDLKQPITPETAVHLVKN